VKDILGASDSECHPAITLVLQKTFFNSTFVENARILFRIRAVNVNADRFPFWNGPLTLPADLK
jgi:hypothetical protein